MMMKRAMKMLIMLMNGYNENHQPSPQFGTRRDRGLQARQMLEKYSRSGFLCKIDHVGKDDEILEAWMYWIFRTRNTRQFWHWQLFSRGVQMSDQPVCVIFSSLLFAMFERLASTASFSSLNHTSLKLSEDDQYSFIILSGFSLNERSSRSSSSHPSWSPLPPEMLVTLCEAP